MSNELINKDSGPQLPAYLQNEEVMGTEALQQYVRPPRLKVVQAMSKAPFDEYKKGTVVVVPQMIEFAKPGDTFKFVPIFFYAEWIQTNPLNKNPFVRERSLDPKSDLAMKAKNRETWTEPHPEDPALLIANREVMNFVIMPLEGQLAGTMMVLSFSKASFRDGSNLASMIQIRRGPIYAQVFEATPAERKNEKGQWFSLDINIPAEQEGAWVSEDEYKVFKELHLDLAKTHEAGVLQVDYDDVPEGSETPAESTEY